MTESGLRIRVDDALRRDFIETCRGRDRTAAQILREFMRAYVDEHGIAIKQEQLFTLPSREQATVRK